MKKVIFWLLLLSFSCGVKSQLNNSWIDYNKTYYTFRLAKDSLCRISQPVLAAAGLGSVNSDHFQLWRNGKQVRLFTSVSGVPLGPADYIEFWGEVNDGKPDKPLYRSPDYQMNDRYSLSTDTVVYFLTVNPAGGNLRYAAGANNPPASGTPEPYFMRSTDLFFKSLINRGFANQVGEYIYSSSYDAGEGYTSNDITPAAELSRVFSSLNVYTAGPANGVSVRIGVFGNAPNYRRFSVRLGTNQIYDSATDGFTMQRATITNIPLSYLQSSNNITIFVKNGSAVSTDRMVVAYMGLTYPARFNFNNQRVFDFELPIAPSGNYLEIENFNHGNVPPVLYNLTDGARYLGDISSTPGRVKFQLPPSAQNFRQFRLMSQASGSIIGINALAVKNFINFSDVSRQANYIIISNPLLYNDGTGNNYVEQYRQYRNSASGGGYNAKIYDINELTDQFAFGIKKHPAAIRDFIRFASTVFSDSPRYVFMIGRGVTYRESRQFESSRLMNQMNLVPTFGWPASDVLLASDPGSIVPRIPIGRLGAITGTEVSYYLRKVIQYEQAQRTSSPLLSEKAWMKNFIHVVGGKDSVESSIFNQYMDGYRRIAEDTFYGARVETFSKTGTAAVQQANSQRIEQLINEGLGFIGYFGHSSANTFEFNLGNPSIYNNTGKYPFFNVSGCSAGNYYVFDTLRFIGNLSLSEKYILSDQKGSIGFLASTHFGIPPFLNAYNLAFYRAFSRSMYGQSVGAQTRKVIQELGGNNPTIDYYSRIHLEELALHGDPAIQLNNYPKPDFAIEDQLVKISPNIISVADTGFRINISMLNLGRAVNDSIRVTVKRRLPNDTVRVLYSRVIRAIRSVDSLNLLVPINPLTDKGLNQISVSLDEDGRVDELFESNNNVTKDFIIYEDELRPVYPYNYAIVNRQGITFSASTANPFNGNRQYLMELDTTALFNSPFRKTYSQSGPGGVIEFRPGNIGFTDSTVYYWRVAIIPAGSTNFIWNNSSFVYLGGSSPGFNQSHYYQHLNSSYDEIELKNDRKFYFSQLPRTLTIRTGLYPYYDFDKIHVYRDFDQLEYYGCGYSRMQVYVFDTVTLDPWKNQNTSSGRGRYGSETVCPVFGTTDSSRAFFEFNYADSVSRKYAMDMLDSIPNGMYVAITNLGRQFRNNSFIADWQKDTLLWGSGNSLYHKLKSIGFSEIDSFYKNLPFLYFYRKARPQYISTQVMGPYDSSYIDQNFYINTISTTGAITSPTFGPARNWSTLRWRGFSPDPTLQGDDAKIQVWGVTPTGTPELLRTVYSARDTSLSFVNASSHPYLFLRMQNTDKKYITPYQLNYWRINAGLVPEGAVAPNVLFSMSDSVDQGQRLNFSMAFKNVSDVNFDSTMKFRFIVTNRFNVAREIDVPRGKLLRAGDTLVLNYSLDTRDLPGLNTLFVEVNPDQHQREMYSFNNVVFREFFVRPDNYNPLLDVTFDGMHILNNDIVSSNPNILIRLKDESRFMALSDTSRFKVQVQFPNESSPRDYYFGGDTMRFIPADLSTGDNTASIEFKPSFAADGAYELIVTGKDAVDNSAGDLAYRVTFNVINKPMISNLFNYPNPFTTSTAFVFTLTGREVPQNIRIQILTITGKIVREITSSELGPVRIGNNITEFKWDGTDMYGQKLANGVYLYRVLTNLNGRRLEKYQGFNSNGEQVTSGLADQYGSDPTDKFFNKGYGKMYLMR